MQPMCLMINLPVNFIFMMVFELMYKEAAHETYA